MENLFWPSSGIALAAVILLGPRIWSAIFLGASVALLWNGHSIVTTIISATGMTLEPLLGYWMLRRTGTLNIGIKSIGSYFGLLLLGAGVAPIISASLQAVGHLAGSDISVGDASAHLFRWWMNDAIGVIMVTPLILVWRQPPRQWFASAKVAAELAVILSLHFLAGQIIFLSWFEENFGHINRGYWLYLFITWAAIRLGTHGVILFVWLAACQGLIGAVSGVGFFGNDIAKTQLSNFWFYNVIVASVGMSIATVLEERRAAERQLQLAASVFDHAREGITITDVRGIIVDVNEAFTRITGYRRDEVIGQNPRILNSGKQDPEFYVAMWGSLTKQGHWSGEIWNRRKNGELFAELLTISAVRDVQGKTQQYVALFSDITAIKTHQGELEQIAHFDALTHLPNRLLLADRLRQAMAQALRRNQQLAVAYLDLDGFKAVNDSHGHDVGDQLLIALAAAMKETLREGDTLARLGGDEFVAVLIDLNDVETCIPMLNRLLELAVVPIQCGVSAVNVSVSIGVTFYPQDQDMDADQLLRQADQAMYQAKQAGKNRYHVFDPAQDSSLRAIHESLERIRLALSKGEFILHYQPKVNMRSGEVIGAEALIRWQHPQTGLLAPSEFLPIVEDHPLAIEIGEWVIETALTQIQVWQAAGFNLPVSVNIGAIQLQQSNFFDRLTSILGRHLEVSPASLELEVLETSALADIAKVSQLIEDCAQIGVKFALDDFGTGYSSLTYLKRLRVTTLKIDQSFVRDMLDDPDDLAILEGVIGLAAAFGRQVIAEGVETISHGTALLQLGCEQAQGYGIARPMPPDQMPAWAASWKPDRAWAPLPNSTKTIDR
jgi:diguanylate cyclase (GGDEF)-like protein/PAS domain S-box-containing protein